MRMNILIFLFFTFVSGKISEGYLQTNEEFAYLDRFCFESESGHLDFFFRYPKNHRVPSLLLYYDDPQQWLRAYTILNTCEDRVDLLLNDTRSNGIVRLSPLSQMSTSEYKCIYQSSTMNSSQPFVICSGSKTFTSARSRWWFMAVSVCSEDEPNSLHGINLEYRLVMTNGQPTDILTFQFSFDQRYLLIITICCTGVCGTLLIAAFIIGWQLSQRRLHHGVYKVFTYCIFIKCLGLLCYLIHYFIYAVNGYGLPSVEIGAQTITYASEIIFLTMLLVLSRGMNVTKMKLSLIETVIVGLFMVILFSMYIALHIWKVFDPALVFFYSESLPGKMITAWKIIACGFVIVSCLITMKGSPAKRWFYTGLVLFYTPWFFATPVIIILANYILDNWVREEVVYLVDNCVTIYGYLIFLYLSWPSQANKNFPFHIRTTQISCSFDPQVNYAATDDASRDEPKVTITTRRTLEEQCRYFEVMDQNGDDHSKRI